MFTTVRASFLLLAAALLAAPHAPAVQAQAAATAPTGKFLHLSDIHFDPFANPDPKFIAKLNGARVDDWEALFRAGAQLPMPGKKQDSNFTLFASTLADAQSQGPYDYVLYSGDYLSHDFVASMQAYLPNPQDRTAFAAKTAAFVNLMIGKSFPNAPLVAALGNNDSSCWDYQLTPDADLLAGVANSLPVLRGNPAATADFAKGGYYLVSHPTVAGQDIAVLGVFWSRKYRDGCNPGAPDPAQAQLTWLQTTLAAEAKAGRKVTLLMHILPGIDGFASSPSQQGTTVNEWTDDLAYLTAFQGLVAKYQAILVGGYAGHTHMDEFRVMPGLALRVGPAITPRDGNRPAYTVFRYHPASGVALGYRTRVLGASWGDGYDFNKAYGIKRYDAASLQALAARVMSDPATRAKFQGYYSAGNPVSSSRAQNWRYFGCALTQLAPTGYGSCVAGK